MTSTPKHRKKVKHYDIPGDAHFLAYSCYRRCQLLSKDRTRLWFIDEPENGGRKLGANVLFSLIWHEPVGRAGIPAPFSPCFTTNWTPHLRKR